MNIDMVELRKYAFKTDNNNDWLFFAELLQSLGDKVYTSIVIDLHLYACTRESYDYLIYTNGVWAGNISKYDRQLITRRQLEKGEIA